MDQNTNCHEELPETDSANALRANVLQGTPVGNKADEGSYIRISPKLRTQENEGLDRVDILSENIQITSFEVRQKVENITILRSKIFKSKLDLDSKLRSYLLEIDSMNVKAIAISNELKKQHFNLPTLYEKIGNNANEHCPINIEISVREEEEHYQNLSRDAQTIPFDLDEQQIKGSLEAILKNLIKKNAPPMKNVSQEQSIDVNKVQIQKLTTFEIPKGEKEIFIRGCTILNKKEVCFADRGNHRLIFMTNKGYHKLFPLPCQPADITVIPGNKLVVSLMELNKIYIINTENMTWETISFYDKSGVSGLTCYDDGIVLRTGEGYSFLTCNGKVVKKIKIVGTKMPYVTCAENRIYFAKWEKNEIHCYDFSGKQMWIYKNESNIISPNGVSADKDGNVFVTGSKSNNVVVISSDGSKCKEILSNQKFPVAIDLDKDNRRLLVCSSNSSAVLYSLQ